MVQCGQLLGRWSGAIIKLLPWVAHCNYLDTSLLERERRWWDAALRFKQRVGTPELSATWSGGSKYLWV